MQKENRTFGKAPLAAVLAGLAAVVLIVAAAFVLRNPSVPAEEENGAGRPPASSETAPEPSGGDSAPPAESAASDPASDPADGMPAAADVRTDPPPPEKEPAEPALADEPPAGPRYVDWSEKAFAEHSGRRRWLNFHADWCPNCRALDADIEASLDDIPADVVIFKVDYDDNQELRRRYGVNRQTTVVSVDAAGGKIDSFLAVGSETLNDLIKELY